jgi:hypothetical protein
MRSGKKFQSVFDQCFLQHLMPVTDLAWFQPNPLIVHLFRVMSRTLPVITRIFDYGRLSTISMREKEKV